LEGLLRILKAYSENCCGVNGGRGCPKWLKMTIEGFAGMLRGRSGMILCGCLGRDSMNEQSMNHPRRDRLLGQLFFING
jgi:hypothetical protein